MTTGKAPTTAIQLRAMRETDLSEVYQLEKLCQPYPWPHWFFRRQMRSAFCWVWLQQDTIIAFGIVAMVKTRAHIMNMCVAPGHRRLGLGRRIMLHLLAVAKKHRARRAWLEVRTGNRQAILLYRKLGFQQQQIHKNYYITRSGRSNAIIMSKPLRP